MLRWMCAVAFAIALLASAPTSDRPGGGAAARQSATPAVFAAPLQVLAAAELPLPARGIDLAWLVQPGAVFGERRARRDPMQVGFVLARRGTLGVWSASGTSLAELAAGQAMALPPGTGGTFASATGDVALYVQIALVPASDASAGSSNSSLSAAFSATADGPVRLELLRGFLNPAQSATMPAALGPTLLLATDQALRVEGAEGGESIVARDEHALLGDAATISNQGQRSASFIVARIVALPAAAGSLATPRASMQTSPSLDPVIDDAWRRNGCHLNPGNAACATVMIAAACVVNPADAACASDGDGDGCVDIAEVRSAFDPFDPSDCIADGRGNPAINCLFLIDDAACDGSHNGASATGAARSEATRRNDFAQKRRPWERGPFPAARGSQARERASSPPATVTPYTRSPSRPGRVCA